MSGGKTTAIYYKWLGKDDTTHGFAWPLPTQNDAGSWTPGEWVDVSDRGPLEPCSATALHACMVRDLSAWVKDGDLFVIEFDGEVADNGDKVYGQRARLLRRIAVSDEIKHLWACEIAEDAMTRERSAGREPDPRSWAAIEAKRKWLRGGISTGEMAAARNAAWSAARNAAWNAAWAAARNAAWAAAWANAAWAAAWAAAGAAAADAAWVAARAAAADAAAGAARAAAVDAARLRCGNMLLAMLGEAEASK